MYYVSKLLVYVCVCGSYVLDYFVIVVVFFVITSEGKSNILRSWGIIIE